MKLYKVESLGLVDKVYDNIKEMILKRELVPGQKLVQEEMATLLGVSRTPILAAFSKLEKELLVNNIPRRGYYINEIDINEKRNLFEIRLRLEPLAALKAARLGSEKDKEELLNSALDAQIIAENEDFAKFNIHDYEFHKKIMVMSQNKMLDMMLSSYNIIGLSNQHADAIDFKTSIASHIELAKAIKAGDSEKSEEIMLKHIEVGCKRISGELDG